MPLPKPAPFVPAPNCLRVEVIFKTPGGVAENVYHVQGTGAVQDLGATALRVIDAFHNGETQNGGIIQWRNPSVSLQKIIARDIGTQNGPAWEKDYNVPGGAAGGPLPDSCTIAVKWTTGLSGRSYRGRTYHVGLNAGDVLNDVLNTTVQSRLLSAYQNMLSLVNQSGWTAPGSTDAAMVVLSKAHANAWRTQALTTPITGVTFADAFIDSQRRRLPGRGT